VAGHRATHGEPFRDLDQLREGDAVIVRTATERLDYRVTDSRIVSPLDTDVLEPVPGRPGEPADAARLTLTTCHPRWASTYRLVVLATLRDRTPVRGGD
jgi:sortase A